MMQIHYPVGAERKAGQPNVAGGDEADAPAQPKVVQDGPQHGEALGGQPMRQIFSRPAAAGYVFMNQNPGR